MMKEIVIVAHNRAGLVADICEVLAARRINIETLDAEEVTDLAVVQLTVDRFDEALQALRDAGFDAISEDALVIRIPDEPGALAKVAKRFKDADIDLRSIRIIRRQNGVATVALATSRSQQVIDLVSDCLVRE